MQTVFLSASPKSSMSKGDDSIEPNRLYCFERTASNATCGGRLVRRIYRSRIRSHDYCTAIPVMEDTLDKGFWTHGEARMEARRADHAPDVAAQRMLGHYRPAKSASSSTTSSCASFTRTSRPSRPSRFAPRCSATCSWALADRLLHAYSHGSRSGGQSARSVRRKSPRPTVWPARRTDRNLRA